MSRLLKTSGLLLTLVLPTAALVGCGGSDSPAPVAVETDEPLRIGDDSPLNDYNPDAN